MKINRTNFFSRRERGIMLIDCIVYCGLFFIVTGLAFELFYTCWDNAKAFRRNADEIVGTVKAGERWREDVRAATARLRVEYSPTGEVVRIPQPRGEVSYRFSDGALWRRSSAKGEWMEILAGVKSSRVEPDKRSQITAWRWEVELTPHRKDARMRPLFTFEAVAPHNN
jgi:hypothetical protein